MKIPGEPTPDEAHVVVSLPAGDVAFIRGFDPDRDRTASRADMVRVIEHLQAALKPAPGTEAAGPTVQRDHSPGHCVSVEDANRVLAETRGSTEDALHRVLDLADELETGPLLVRGDSTAARIRTAVAGPQRDHAEEGGQ